VARSSVETEYRAMASATCELIWLKQLLKELQFGHLYVIIRLLFILAQIQFFMREPNILRLIVISFEKRLYREISRLSLLNQIIN